MTHQSTVMEAPSDKKSPLYTFTSTGLKPIPTDIIDFRTIVVACIYGPLVLLDRAKYFANTWGSKFINFGNAAAMF